jgi:uncharacterized protein
MLRADLMSLIEADPALATLWGEVEALSDDSAHDLGHIVRVALWTIRLAQDEVPARLCVVAALLHDFVNVPKDSPLRSQASALSAQHARERLPALGFGPDEIEPIADAILNHSFSRGATPQTRLGRALQDADRLEALGAVGMMRTAAIGGKMGAAFAHLGDPWALERGLDDKAYSIDHCFTKLFKLPETMHHEAARAEARRRARFLSGFLVQFGEELGDPPPALPYGEG